MNSTLLLLKGKISDVNLIELKGRLDRMASVGHYSLDLSPVLSTLKSRVSDWCLDFCSAGLA